MVTDPAGLIYDRCHDLFGKLSVRFFLSIHTKHDQLTTGHLKIVLDDCSAYSLSIYHNLPCMHWSAVAKAFQRLWKHQRLFWRLADHYGLGVVPIHRCQSTDISVHFIHDRHGQRVHLQISHLKCYYGDALFFRHHLPVRLSSSFHCDDSPAS